MRRMKRMKRQRGLTLLELVVAIVVLSIGSLAALRSSDQARAAIGAELPRLLADTAARNRAQELQLLGPFANLPSVVKIGPMDITLSQTRQRTQAGLVKTTLLAQTPSGQKSGLTLYLPPDIPGAFR